MPTLHDRYRETRDRVRRTISDVLSTEYPAPLTVPVEQVFGHCYCTATETRAVYVLRDCRFANQPAGTQAQTRDLQTAAWASLIGRHVKIRIAPVALNPDPWAVAHIRSAPNPAGENGDLLLDHVVAGANRQREPWMREWYVVADVRLTGAEDGCPNENWQDQDTEVVSRLAGDGLHATRAPVGVVDWLIRTSIAPGHTVLRPGLQRLAENMAEYTAQVDWTAPIGARMVKITAATGEVRWVAALTISTMQDRACPGGPAPWMSAVQSLGFDAHLVVSGNVIKPEDAAPKFEKRARWQNDQIKHQLRVGEQPEDHTVETFGAARRLAGQLKTGDVGAVVEWVGRIVIPGESPEECAERSRTAIKVFDVGQHITLVWERDQVTAVRELIPGVREIDRGFHRYSDVALWSVGVANQTGRIGQKTGMDLGYTSGAIPGRRVFFDPWYPTEVLNRAAIYPVLGDMGAGRSTLGLRIIQECILHGIPLVAIDPAGEWTNVGLLPGAKGRVRIIDLSGRTADMTGLLALKRIIPDPDPIEFTTNGQLDEAAYNAALGKAREERVAASIDAMRSIFDRDTWINETRREAIKDAAWDCDGDLWAAVDWLNRPDEERHVDPDTGKVTVTNQGGCAANRRLARELTSAAHGSARLLFPPRGQEISTNRDLLQGQVTIITMRGMQMPAPGSDQDRWTAAERSAALIMHLTAYLGQRLIEEWDRLVPRGRKLLMVDEASSIANWPSGVTWISGGVRHSRRLNCPYVLMSQHPGDLARLDPERKVFATGGFVGWHDKLEMAVESLALINAPEGLERVVTSLTLIEREDEDDPGRLPGEFLFLDADRWIQQVRVDLEPYPLLAVVANTTPGRTVTAVEFQRPQLAKTEPADDAADVYGPNEAAV